MIFFSARQRGAIGALSLFCSMIFIPCAVAFIAKLALTNTLHMGAAHLLLNRLTALRALSCVVANPAWVCFFGIDEIVPSLDVFAGHWVVWFSATAVAVELSTRTGDSTELHHVGLDAKIGAFLIWAVANVLVLYSITHTSFLSVKLRQLRCHHLHEATESRCTRTCWNMHAAWKYASFQELMPKVPHPTRRAVSMRA